MSDLETHFITQLVLFIFEYFPLIVAVIFIYIMSLLIVRNMD